MLTCQQCNGELRVENVIEGPNDVIEIYCCQECGRKGRYQFNFITNASKQVGSIFN